MGDELAAARSHPAVVVSIVIAAVAVTALALVTIAYLLGWIPTKASAPTPAGMASPGQQVTGTLPDVVLLPGETLVTPPEGKVPAAAGTPAAPTTPHYAKNPESAPRKPAPAPPPYAPPASRSGTPAPTYAPPPPRAAPAAPSPTASARKEPPLTSYERSTRSICINCGTIASIRSVADDWEVRVRFEDGSSETLRYPERPRMRIGDRVLLEEGRLVPN
jgi:hypothetical protein